MSRIVSDISQNHLTELKSFGIDLRVLEKLDADQTRDLYMTISTIWAAIKKAEIPQKHAGKEQCSLS